MLNKNFTFPHRITLLDEKTCDVCKSINKTSVLRVKNAGYMGFRVCDNKDCKKKASDWMKKSTISHEELIKEFGSWIYVKRSNGETESSWVIKGDAYKEKEDEPFWILVRDEKRHRSKCVSLKSLREWNS